MADTKQYGKLSPKEYELMGKQLESLYEHIHPSKKALYKAALVKGMLGGVGGVIGATLGIAVIAWILSLFDNIPLIGSAVDAVRHTLQSK